jgi:hypothetical protein
LLFPFTVLSKIIFVAIAAAIPPSCSVHKFVSSWGEGSEPRIARVVKSWRRQIRISKEWTEVQERESSPLEMRKRNGYKTPIDQSGGKQEKKDQLSEPAVMVLKCEVKECNGDCPQNSTRALRHENEAARDCA